MMFSSISLLFLVPSLLVNRRNSFLSVISSEHASEVFRSIDTDSSGNIVSTELKQVLERLDINKSKDDMDALFMSLDTNGDGKVVEKEFLDWYQEMAQESDAADIVRRTIQDRKTVNNFDRTPVPDSVLHNAIEAAISAPNHKLTEPWRFISLGKETISKISELNAAEIAKKDPEKGLKKKKRWEAIPGWCVVTSKKSDAGVLEEEDFAATCCAVQNFLLSMWTDGVGTKWTSGPITRTTEFAELCGINLDEEKFVGCIWYGFASGGLNSLNNRRRKLSVNDVLSSKP